MHQNGQGVSQDDKQAIEWYRKAAEQGYAPAKNSLGVMYERGQGVPQDYKQAMEWYSKAAEMGDAAGQINLGLMYENGWGGARDVVIAYMLYSVAAAYGNAHAADKRVAVAEHMTSEQIQEGQDLAIKWRPSYPLPTNSETGADPK